MVYPTACAVVTPPFFRVFIFIILVMASASLIAVALYVGSKTMHTYGYLKKVGVEIYRNGDCAEVLDKIDWGMLEPLEEKNVTAYIKNTSNVPVTLKIFTGNWIPSNVTLCLEFTCSGYNGKEIAVGEVVEVTFTLTVSAETSGFTAFSFDIHVVGSG